MEVYFFLLTGMYVAAEQRGAANTKDEERIGGEARRHEKKRKTVAHIFSRRRKRRILIISSPSRPIPDFFEYLKTIEVGITKTEDVQYQHITMDNGSPLDFHQ
jgi:hypothetical protein